VLAAWSQHRVDAFVQIVRDPRLQRYVDDKALHDFTDTDVHGHRAPREQRQFLHRPPRQRHEPRGNNYLRDWLDEGASVFRRANTALTAESNDAAEVARVKEFYKSSEEMGVRMEQDRRTYLSAMARIKEGMILGGAKNVYVEPAIWTIEWAQRHYKHPQRRSN
jgi:hypothetical protein